MPDAFVARQPIFNHKLEVVGYELLFRGSGYVDDTPAAEPERATATVVLNALTELDLKRVVGYHTAWVNVSREFVLDGLAYAIPPGQLGLELPADELFDDEMLAALGELKRQGYRLALDDFRHRQGGEPPFELFDVVKLNLEDLGREQLREQVARLRPYPPTLLAQKLATHDDHAFCVEAGCDLFQGYFFCRPAVVCTRGIAANRLALLQVVAALNDPAVELSDVERLMAHDLALSFRLLRYVNSAYFGLRAEVRSIGQALALLGLENVRRWATLSVLASIDDKPTELTVTALIRARFCELAGEQLGIASPAELFTLGLFSVIDGMLDAPMRDVVATLPFAAEMRDALVLRRGQLGRLLDCVDCLQGGEYGAAPAFLPRAGDLYLEALMWANTAAESLLGEATAPAAQPTPGRVTLAAQNATRSANLSTSKPPSLASKPPPVAKKGAASGAGASPAPPVAGDQAGSAPGRGAPTRPPLGRRLLAGLARLVGSRRFAASR